MSDKFFIKTKKISPDAKLPKRASEHAAAFDLTGNRYEIVHDPMSGVIYIEYHTGLAMEIPIGYVGKLFPRSSVSKTGMILSNCVGLVDPDYRGEITFRFKYFGGQIFGVGDRIGQIRIEKDENYDFVEVTELDDTKRGTGGYGSTGR